MTSDVLIRPATLEDRPFIATSWLRSFRRSPWAESIWGKAPEGKQQGPAFERDERGRTYWTRYGHAGFVDDVLADDDHYVRVACLDSDPSFIFGFICVDVRQYERPQFLLHYVYAKKDYRRAGVGKALCDFRGHPIAVTAETPAWKAFAAKHGIAYEYRHPYRKERP